MTAEWREMREMMELVAVQAHGYPGSVYDRAVARFVLYLDDRLCAVESGTELNHPFSQER